MSEFAPICIYLVISLLVSLIPLVFLFHFLLILRLMQKNCRPTNVLSILSVMPEVASIYRFYLVSILYIILDSKVTFFFPWAVPLNKIDPLDLGP
ncbi:NADH-ubiquinone oxidoreductase chain 3 [Bienertia sinuspersici]